MVFPNIWRPTVFRNSPVRTVPLPFSAQHWFGPFWKIPSTAKNRLWPPQTWKDSGLTHLPNSGSFRNGYDTFFLPSGFPPQIPSCFVQYTTLFPTEKILKNKNVPGWLVTTLRGQILYTGIFHLVPSISIHYNRAGVILKHGKSSRTYETSAALHRPKLHLKSWEIILAE